MIERTQHTDSDLMEALAPCVDSAGLLPGAGG